MEDSISQQNELPAVLIPLKMPMTSLLKPLIKLLMPSDKQSRIQNRLISNGLLLPQGFEKSFKPT